MYDLPEIMKSENHENSGISLAYPDLSGPSSLKKKQKRKFFKLLYATAHTSNRLHITTKKRNRRIFYLFKV